VVFEILFTDRETDRQILPNTIPASSIADAQIKTENK